MFCENHKKDAVLHLQDGVFFYICKQRLENIGNCHDIKGNIGFLQRGDRECGIAEREGKMGMRFPEEFDHGAQMRALMRVAAVVKSFYRRIRFAPRTARLGRLRL
ncbi:MAG: hypothetical protein IJW11_04675 [Clostridia bacterium]|nr:hypothetical protein [Clostridia bacterium]